MKMKLLPLIATLSISLSHVTYAASPTAPKRHEASPASASAPSGCPAPSVIAPCVCSEAPGALPLLDCAQVVSENQLQEVFSRGGTGGAFGRLSMNGNEHVEHLTAGVFGNASFVHASLAGTHVAHVDLAAFSASRSTLDRLDLFHARLASLDASALPGFQALTMLDARHNLLPSAPRLSSPYLAYLDLSENQIMEIESDTFVGLLTLEVLFLGNNKLTSIPTGIGLDLKIKF